MSRDKIVVPFGERLVGIYQVLIERVAEHQMAEEHLREQMSHDDGLQTEALRVHRLVRQLELRVTIDALTIKAKEIATALNNLADDRDGAAGTSNVLDMDKYR